MLLEFQDALNVGGVTNWVDSVAIVVLALFFLHGVVKGFATQLVGILLLILALGASTLFSQQAGTWLRSTKTLADLPEKAAHYLSFLLIFVVALGIGSLLARLLRGAIEKAGGIPYDRLFGGILGGLKAALLIMVVVIGVANLFYDEEEQKPMGMVADVVESRCASATRWTAEKAVIFLPKELAEVFETYSLPLKKPSAGGAD